MLIASRHKINRMDVQPIFKINNQSLATKIIFCDFSNLHHAAFICLYGSSILFRCAQPNRKHFKSKYGKRKWRWPPTMCTRVKHLLTINGQCVYIGN